MVVSCANVLTPGPFEKVFYEQLDIAKADSALPCDRVIAGAREWFRFVSVFVGIGGAMLKKQWRSRHQHYRNARSVHHLVTHRTEQYAFEVAKAAAAHYEA